MERMIKQDSEGNFLQDQLDIKIETDANTDTKETNVKCLFSLGTI